MSKLDDEYSRSTADLAGKIDAYFTLVGALSSYWDLLSSSGRIAQCQMIDGYCAAAENSRPLLVVCISAYQRPCT